MAKKEKSSIEILLTSVSVSGLRLSPKILKTSRLVTADLIWPRSSIAKKTSAREVEFSRSKANLESEEWTRRVFFREEIEGHAGLAVSVSEVLDDEWIEKFLRSTAKYALREFSSLIQKYTVGISDIASAPVEALAALEGTYPGPKTVLQGVFDITDELMPKVGEVKTIEVSLHRPGATKKCGSAAFELRSI